MIIKDIAHILAGVASAIVTFSHPVIGVVMTILFIIYQLDESWHIKDESWLDILEYSIGYYATSTIYVLAKILNICTAI
ncbi:MAG: hypothetical protein RMI45_08830 [Ignisphaera sp.]|nr:hypothetical protein [Ignisphaera sp.]